jgi:hypothetical protein
MWPGVFSKAAASVPKGGTAMFAFLALAGDVGCAGGPTVVGMVSGVLGNNLKMGILAGVVFPVVLLKSVCSINRNRKSFDLPNEREVKLK